jgi:transposase
MTAATWNEYSGKTLYVAFELGLGTWKLASTVGRGQKPRLRTITAGNRDEIERELKAAKGRFDLEPDCRVMSCYEAGRDGFWVHRHLTDLGVESLVVDAASIEIPRRRRRAKTDRLDASKLVSMLIRYDEGEAKVWSVVRVPTVEAEDGRRLHRELMTLKRERTRQVNRIKGLFASHGVRMEKICRTFEDDLERATQWDGGRLPRGLRTQVLLEYQRLVFIKGQIKWVTSQQGKLFRESRSAIATKARKIERLRGLAMNSAWVFSAEFFAWREFSNRREVGSLAGLTPTPYRSGTIVREQGIDKAGNKRVRNLAIEIAWGWLRFQPNSAITK